jgi:hypothetical protein
MLDIGVFLLKSRGAFDAGSGVRPRVVRGHVIALLDHATFPGLVSDPAAPVFRTARGS